MVKSYSELEIEDFAHLKKINKERKRERIENASKKGWYLHTEYHWSRSLNGKRLDYWPSKSKFMYEGIVKTGDVEQFIKRRAQR